MIGRAALALALLVAPAEASAAALAVTLSTDRVEISSSFTGTALTVFGAIEDGGIDMDNADIIVVLRGPPETVTTRRKERILGLWLNRSGATFADIPSFYAAHSTATLAEITDPAVLDGLKLGLDTLLPRDDDFAAALLRLRQEGRLYVERAGAVERIGATAFRTDFGLPADVPVGDFDVMIYLFGEDGILDYAERSLVISKIGSEQLIHQASLDYPWLYAFAVVAIAIGAGWLGGVLFRRD